MRKRISLAEIKKFLNDAYGFNIANSKRKREYVYARKVFCRLGRDYHYTFSSIAEEINTTHCSALYHSNSFDVIDVFDMDIYKECKTFINHAGLEYDKIIRCLNLIMMYSNINTKYLS